MLKKIISTLILTAFGASVLLTKPLSLHEVNASEPVSRPISLYITGKIQVVSSPLSGIKVVLFRVMPSKNPFNKMKIHHKFTQTNGDGQYTFENLSGGNYIVKPTSKIYLFEPKQQDLTLINDSIENIDFQAQVK